jgi:hypothetical protein
MRGLFFFPRQMQIRFNSARVEIAQDNIMPRADPLSISSVTALVATAFNAGRTVFVSTP